MIKKIITFLIIFSFLYNYTFSNFELNEKLIYKQTLITRSKIKREFIDWEKINKKIENMFLMYRYKKDVKWLKDLQELLKKQIIYLNNKNVKSRIDNKKILIYNHMYYRTIILLEYQLK